MGRLLNSGMRVRPPLPNNVIPSCVDPCTASPELNPLAGKVKDSLDKKGNPQKVHKGPSKQNSSPYRGRKRKDSCLPRG
jgi:hypothetical protein